MRPAFDILSIVAIAGGAFFFLAGTVGLLRFPDTLTRLHALTKADNLGLGLVVLGLIPQFDSGVAAVKLVVVWLLVLLASAVVSQLIARAARRASLQLMIEALNIVLVAMILGLAAWTIATRDAFAATVGFLVYGLLLALAWVSLRAIDVALTEAAIGAGLTGALLIGAASRLRTVETAAAERTAALDPRSGRLSPPR